MVTDVLASRALTALEAGGYLTFVRAISLSGHGWRGTFDLGVLPRLRSDPRFASGCFYGLHTDIGDDLCDFRSYNDTLGPGSLQLVIDQHTGRFWADVDRYNPYQDLVRFLGHAFGEVVPHFARKAWAWIRS